MSRKKIHAQPYKEAQATAEKIFRYKNKFHQTQAKLPVEKKIKMVVELQKIVFKLKKGDPFLSDKIVWRI